MAGHCSGMSRPVSERGRGVHQCGIGIDHRQGPRTQRPQIWPAWPALRGKPCPEGYLADAPSQLCHLANGPEGLIGGKVRSVNGKASARARVGRTENAGGCSRALGRDPTADGNRLFGPQLVRLAPSSHKIKDDPPRERAAQALDCGLQLRTSYPAVLQGGPERNRECHVQPKDVVCHLGGRSRAEGCSRGRCAAFTCALELKPAIRSTRSEQWGGHQLPLLRRAWIM